jgi:hypothetical protein
MTLLANTERGTEVCSKGGRSPPPGLAGERLTFFGQRVTFLLQRVPRERWRELLNYSVMRGPCCPL